MLQQMVLKYILCCNLDTLICLGGNVPRVVIERMGPPRFRLTCMRHFTHACDEDRLRIQQCVVVGATCGRSKHYHYN